MVMSSLVTTLLVVQIHAFQMVAPARTPQITGSGVDGSSAEPSRIF